MTGAAPDLSKLRINRDAPSPAVKKALGRNLLLLALAAIVVVVAMLVMRGGSATQIRVVTAAAASTAGAAGSGGATSVTANGYVVARTKAAVSVKIPGRLAFLGVSEGSFVRRDSIIARLDNADYQAAVAQAEANTASAQASVIEAESDRDQLQREAARLQNVRTQNANLVSQQELDLAASRASQAEARLGAATARRQAAQAGVRMAQANLDNTYIRAPFTGTVLRKEAEVGEVVAPSVGGGLTRGAVAYMADLSTLEVEVDVNEAYIARIRSRQRARITLDAYPDTAFRGTVRQVVPTADRQRATVQVKVVIDDHDPRILPEMGAKVDFLEPDSARPTTGAAPAAPRIRVPEAAVFVEAGATLVYLVRDGRLERRTIVAGPVSGGFREVSSGLSGGEQLMVGGGDQPQPRQGLRVKIGT